MTEQPPPEQNIRPPRPAAAAVAPPPRDPGDFLQHVRQLTNLRQEIRILAAPRVDVLPPRQARQARLEAMRLWQATAWARLDDLRAGRTGPQGQGRPIPDELRPEATDLQRRLIVSMSKNAARMATLEGTQRRWHVAMKVAREGIRLRREVAADAIGAPTWRESGLGAPSDTDTLNDTISQLEQQAADLRIQLSERDDELAAARAANRELMTRINHAAKN